MGLPARKTDHHYTYKDCRTWPEDERWELIDGVAFAMSSPTTYHQHIVFALGKKIDAYLAGAEGKLFLAPLDVFFPRLNEQDEDDVDTVVQPDLVVTCDRSRIRPRGLWGAPDLAVEILSPTTAGRDYREKFTLYERSGVKEYWIVHPQGRWLQQYVLGTDGRYGPEVTLELKGTVVSTALPGLEIDTTTLWPDF